MSIDFEALSPEIWEEVFEWLCVERQVPSRHLALVCRRWRQIMWNLPALWRTVEINLQSGDAFDILLDRLERRLNLAKGVTLDVVLKNTRLQHGLSKDQYSHLFRTLVKLAPVERWYSLWMEEKDYLPDYDPIAIEGISFGRFSSLRVLSLCGVGYRMEKPQYHSTIFRQIAKSKPRLQEIYLMIDFLPLELAEGSLAQLLKGVRTIGAHMRLLRLADEDPEILASCYELITIGQQKLPFRNPPRILLPQSVTIDQYTPHRLQGFNANNVVILCINGFNAWSNRFSSVDMPNLRTLEIRPCLPQNLLFFNTPRVERIVLWGVKTHMLYPVIFIDVPEKPNNAATLRFFRKEREKLTQNPLSLKIDLENVLDEAFVAVLEAWAQLKHLSMRIGGETDLSTLFAKRMLDQSSVLCPQLETIYFETWWDAGSREWREWREVARELMLSRRDGPLKSVIWRNSWFDVESVTRERVLGNAD
ncbi:hypothetical protein FRC17_009353 [Serendipita sp. 399]|nr:hypothetical protein FRC17_009353 [Serendipita sp. 399]